MFRDVSEWDGGVEVEEMVNGETDVEIIEVFVPGIPRPRWGGVDSMEVGMSVSRPLTSLNEDSADDVEIVQIHAALKETDVRGKEMTVCLGACREV
jgi:hypothetical protein